MLDLVEEIESYSPQTAEPKPTLNYGKSGEGQAVKASLIENPNNKINNGE